MDTMAAMSTMKDKNDFFLHRIHRVHHALPQARVSITIPICYFRSYFFM